MPVFLPDVNVLVALHDPQHAGHEAAHAWFEADGRNGWATCPITENGFVRVFANTQYPNHVGRVSAAISILEKMLQVYGSTHISWPDDQSLTHRNLFDSSAVAGPKQLTDVYLLGLCQHNRGTLATLDRGITTDSIVSPRPDLLRTL